MTQPGSEPAAPHPPDSPPILRSWRNLYALVLGVLALDILLLYVFMRIFS